MTYEHIILFLLKPEKKEAVFFFIGSLEKKRKFFFDLERERRNILLDVKLDKL